MQFTLKGSVCLALYYDTFKSGCVGGAVSTVYAEQRIKDLRNEGWSIDSDKEDVLILRKGRKQARHVFENVDN